MTALDRDLIRRKLEEVREYLQKLEEFRAMEKQKYLADYHHYALAEHFLRLALEATLDICRHLVVALELKTPEDAHGLFPLLAQQGILGEDFVKRNRKMPGLRNRLVHVYAGIDHERTYDYLQKHFADFGEFSRQISEYLLQEANREGN